MRTCLLLVVGLLGAISSALNPVRAQALASSTSGEVGQPFLTCYSPEEFGGHVQSWAFVQTGDGVLYAGNGMGGLEFDGASWRLIQTSNRRFVRSLATDESGRVYVGSGGDVGYFAADSLGRSTYVSLVSHLPEEYRTFSYVWTTHATPQGVYFQTLEQIMRFNMASDDPRVDVWRPMGQFAYSFWLQDTLYVNQTGVGLMKMVDDSLQLLPGGTQFANDRIHVLLPHRPGPERGGLGPLLVGTFSRGFFVFDGRSFRPWRTEVSEWMREQTPYAAVLMDDEMYAIGTLSGGVVVADFDGNIQRILDSRSGLPSQNILSIFRDREDAIWVAPENGICRVEMPSPLTIFNVERGLADIASDIIRHNGTLYVSTSNGAFWLDGATGQFLPVRGLGMGNRQTWKFAAVDEEMLLATGEGVYRIDGGSASPVRPNTGGLTYASLYVHRSKSNPNRVFVGLFDRLGSLLRQPNGEWLDEGDVPGVEGYIARIVEPEPGTLWLVRADNSPLRARFSDDRRLPDTVEVIGESFGLPSGMPADILMAADGIFALNQERVFRLDPTRDYFEPDTILAGTGHRERVDYHLVEDQDGNLWANLGAETVFLRKKSDGTFERERTAALRFFDKPAAPIYPETGGVVWFSTSDGLIRYDSSIPKDYDAPFAAMIREVVVTGEGLSAESGELHLPVGLAAEEADLRLSSTDNNLRVKYAASSLERPKETQYQSILEGFDARWSSWSKETSRSYTNLPPGRYTFRVKARNIYGVEGSEARYAFAILPPWYRTWWAYLLYLVGAVGVVWLLVRVRTGQLEARGRALEEVVEQRTQELRRQKENVEILSRIGRDITASLDFDIIFNRLYENVNRMLDAPIFGVGIYQQELQLIDYRLAVERGKRYAPYTRDMKDKNQLPVWCIENREPILIRDFEQEYGRYIKTYTENQRLLEDGSVSQLPRSLMYLPLVAKDRVLGVVTVQSFERDAYGEYEMSILQSLAAYASTALDNANAYERLNETLEHLKAVQQQLIHQEKLASLGSMTAGIAHEIKNPLNFVNNFAALSVELAAEIEDTLHGANGFLEEPAQSQLRDALADLRVNCAKIEEHGKRANGIVKSMLEHSRGSGADRRPIDVNDLVDEYLNLAYHGVRAQDVNFTCSVERQLDPEVGSVDAAPQDIGRVLINLLNNAFYAVNQRREKAEGIYLPTVRATTQRLADGVEVSVWDNGGGIPREVREHIFEPFFTTKPTGEGTGLGLSLSYEIVTQGHGGRLEVDSEEGESTEFRLFLPYLGVPTAEPRHRPTTSAQA